MSPARGTFYFFDSFIIAALQTVIPQLFFLRTDSPVSQTWLGACLLIGAGSMMAGIAVSRRYPLERLYHGGLLYKRVLPASGIVLALILAGMFSVDANGPFTMLYGGFAFTQAYLFNAMDNAWLKTLPLTALRSHSQTAILYQAVGTILGPLFFTWLAAPWSHIGVAVAGGALIGVLIHRLVRSGRLQELREDPRAPSTSGLAKPDKWFLVYGLMVYAATVVLTANIVLLMQSYYRVAHAPRLVGAVLGLSNFLGVVAVLGYFLWPQIRARLALKARPGPSRTFPYPTHGIIVTTFVVASILFYVRLSTTLPYILVLGGACGISFGLFRLLAREYASRRVALFGQAGLLTAFNNLHSIGQIVAFASLSGLALMSHWGGTSLSQRVIITVGLFMLAGGGALVALQRELRHEAPPARPEWLSAAIGGAEN